MKKIIIILFLSFTSIGIYSQDNLIEQLKTEYQLGQFDKIISENFEKASTYPAKAIYYVAMAYYMKENDNNCIKYMDLSIEKDDTNSDSHYIKGMTLNYMGKFEQSILSFNKAIELNPNNSNYYSGLADNYLNQMKLEKALEYYKRATKTKKVIDRPFVMIPQIYAELNQPDNALKHFYIAKDKISKNTNSYITILYNIGISERLKKNYIKAEIVLKELIEIAPTDFNSYSNLIQVYYGKKEYHKAKPYIKKLYEAYDKGILEGTIKEMFCFDQFEWNDKSIRVFERYAVKEGDLYYKHLFYIVNGKGEIEYRIQTENFPFAAEFDSPKYAVGMDKNGMHYTYGFIKENFKYDDLKSVVIQILNKEIEPTSSSTSATNYNRTKKEK